MVVNEDTEDERDDEIFALEEAISELAGKQDGAGTDDGNEIYAIEESEAAELLTTVLAKKKTYMRTLKAKKSKELHQAYGGGSRSGATAAPRAT